MGSEEEALTAQGTEERDPMPFHVYIARCPNCMIEDAVTTIGPVPWPEYLVRVCTNCRATVRFNYKIVRILATPDEVMARRAAQAVPEPVVAPSKPKSPRKRSPKKSLPPVAEPAPAKPKPRKSAPVKGD